MLEIVKQQAFVTVSCHTYFVRLMDISPASQHAAGLISAVGKKCNMLYCVVIVGNCTNHGQDRTYKSIVSVGAACY